MAYKVNSEVEVVVAPSGAQERWDGRVYIRLLGRVEALETRST